MNIAISTQGPAEKVAMTRQFLEMGIRVQEVVTLDIDYLVTGVYPEKGKSFAAGQRDLPIVSKDEFMKLLEDKFPEYIL